MPFAVALSGLNAASSDLSVTANNIANANTTGFKASRVGIRRRVRGRRAEHRQRCRHVVGDAGVLAGRRRLHRSRPRPRDQRRGLLHDERSRRHRRIRAPARSASTATATSSTISSSGCRSSRSPATARSTRARCPTCGSRRPTRRRKRRRGRSSASTCRPMLPPPSVPMFDPANASSYNHSTAVTIYDSLGASHTATAYFVKTATAEPVASALLHRRHGRRRREHHDLLEPGRADGARRRRHHAAGVHADQRRRADHDDGRRPELDAVRLAVRREPADSGRLRLGPAVEHRRRQQRRDLRALHERPLRAARPSRAVELREHARLAPARRHVVERDLHVRRRRARLARVPAAWA